LTSVVATSSFAEDAVKTKATTTASKTAGAKVEKKDLNKLVPAAKKLKLSNDQTRNIYYQTQSI
jgi:hypothetical protein